MPIVHIEIVEGRPQEKIEALIKEVTSTVEHVLEAPKQSIRVVVTEMPKTHYGIGGVSAKELGR